MDALSAMKMVTALPTGGLSAHAAQDVASVAKSIPTAELQQLGSVSSDSPLGSSSATSSGSSTFANVLGDMVNDVAQKRADAGSAVNGLLSGQNVSMHQAMISMEEANVSFQMMVEVRNRLLDSYQELMRMQI
jgi:flagellar hook-basal body complex protein FliE